MSLQDQKSGTNHYQWRQALSPASKSMKAKARDDKFSGRAETCPTRQGGRCGMRVPGRYVHAACVRALCPRQDGGWT